VAVNTIRFMGIWEQMNNPDFNVTEFGNIKNERCLNCDLCDCYDYSDDKNQSSE
jgi:hypothetical protein